MSTDQKIIKNKVGLLKLAEMLGSVSQACGAAKRLAPSGLGMNVSGVHMAVSSTSSQACPVRIGFHDSGFDLCKEAR